jgi:O-antigen ligase
MQQAVRSTLFPSTQRDVFGQQIVLVSLVVAVVCALGPMSALIFAVVLGMVALLLFAPSRWVLLFYVLFMGFTHQMRSFVTLEAGGVEWHPRELLLFGLLAHGAVKIMQGRGRPVPDPIHLFIVITGIYFVQIAVVGLLRQYDLHLIVAELRSPLALASYGVLVLLMRKSDLPVYLRAFFLMTMSVATVAILYFFYTFVTGDVINVQNVWGEYVPRPMVGKVVQSIRPSGHVYYEVCLTVLASFAISPLLSKRQRAHFFVCLAVLSLAIAITFMRTAYVSAFISLVILAWLAMPGWQIRTVALGLFVFVLIAVTVLLAGPVGDLVTIALPTIGTSIQARFIEMEGAYRVFQRNPGVGAGMGSTFEAFGLAAKTSQFAYAQGSYQTVHNTWMYYLFKGGILGGFLIIVGFFGVFIEMCRRISRLENWRDQCLLRGIAAAYCGQMVSCLAMPRLLYPQGYAFVAMTAAFAVIVAADSTRDTTTSSDSHV